MFFPRRVVVLLMMMLHLPVSAQSVPSQPGLLTDSPVQSSISPELGKPSEAIVLHVQEYLVKGVEPDQANRLNDLLAPYTGENRSFEDLSNAAQAVTAYLQRELGYYLAYAYLPAQDVEAGRVIIQALPGMLESVEVQWPDEPLHVSRDIILAHLERLKVGSAIQVSEVERIVFLLNDLRGIRMSFAIKPGIQPGHAILVATPANDRALSGNLSLDSNGSRFAGAYRGAATLSWDSPFGLGDSFSISHLQSNTSGMDFTLLGYTLPVGADGLKLGLNVSTVRYELNQQDFPLGLNGDARSAGAFALYPLVRSRNLNVFALAGYDRKTFTDRQTLTGLQTVKALDSFRLGISGDSRDAWAGGGLNFHQLNAEQSKVHYPAGVPFGLDDDLDALRLNYSLGRLQTWLPGRLMFWGHLRGQFAFDNLDSSEHCSLGGSNAVRAFAQGESSGDECDLLTLELRYLPTSDWLGVHARELSFNLFYDQGRLKVRKDASARVMDFDNHEELAGYGIGLAWDRPGVFTFNLSLAWELAGVRKSDPKPESPRISASYVYYF